MKPILVWGATGFIGRHVINKLIDNEIPVIAITRRHSVLPKFDSNQSFIRWVPVADGDAGIGALAEAIQQVEIVFNLVGYSGPVESNLNPAAGLESDLCAQIRFLKACELSGSRPHVVFSSSRLVYGTPDSLPVTESCSAKPRSYYAVHKLAVEHYLQIASLRSVITYTICRITNPYGLQKVLPGHWRGFIDTMIDNACRGIPLEIYGDGSQLRDYIYIDDLIDALYRCAFYPQAQNEIINIGYGESISIMNAAQLISEYSGTAIVNRPWEMEATFVETGDFVADITKARNLLSFQPKCRLRDTMRQLIRNRS